MSGYVPPHKRGARNSRQSSNNDRFNRPEEREPRQQNDRRQGGFSNRDVRSRNTGNSSFSGGDVRSRASKGRFSMKKSSSALAQKEMSTEKNEEYERELFGNSTEVAIGINFSEYEKIPVDVSGLDCPAGIDSFDELLVTPALLNNIDLCKFQTPTPIQKFSIPTVLANRDLMACAQTGSGKTAAFLIPIIEALCRSERPETRGSRSKFYPRALILAPTRELAQQIHVQAKKLTYCCGMRSVCVYGGSNIHDQFSDLGSGVDILVATPGRLWDMIERNKMSLSQVRFLCMDEADRMLDMGFEPQIRQIISEADMNADRRTLMYSATFPDEIQLLAHDFLVDYIFLAVGRVGSLSLVARGILRAPRA